MNAIVSILRATADAIEGGDQVENILRRIKDQHPIKQAPVAKQKRDQEQEIVNKIVMKAMYEL